MSAWLVDLGTIEYGEAWRLQKSLVERRAINDAKTVMLLLPPRSV